MKIGIMQPYFFPYIGYFQLINAVDKFVVYDNVKFVKKGWFNRNKLLFNNEVKYFSINLKSDSDYLYVKDRQISPVYFEKEMPKILRKINQYYRDAPYHRDVFPLLKDIFENKDTNLFSYVYNSILKINQYLKLDTEIIVASNIPVNHTLKSQWRIYEICSYLKANQYINPIGGETIYSKEEFKEKGIQLYFLKSKNPAYKQYCKEFISHLSIIDVMMFNSPETINAMLDEYQLV